jgi:hypothetical protein
MLSVRAPRIAVLALLAPLAACGGGSEPQLGPNLAYARSYPGLSCAPFARQLTGIGLSGDAADWWPGADGRYRRTDTPEVGSVLVFRRSSRLPSGHVSVVSRVLDDRHIHVIQANWVRGELDEDQLVVDISPGNDWTQVRVWYPPTGLLGTHAYATFGFVLPARLQSHDALVAGAQPAARAVTGG